MKKFSKLLVIGLVLILAVGLLGSCGGNGNEDTEGDSVSTAKWVDEYAALMESGEKNEYKNYDAIMTPMRDYQTEVGAQYVYCVATAENDNLDGSYILTVDASEEPEEWGIDYGFEIQFKEAAEGEVAAARSAWQDGDDAWCWSAFAPVKDAEGNVVAIVGIDYPAELIKDYPQWDRNNKNWNHEEGEWPEDMPEQLETFVNECKDRATTLAEQLQNLDIEVK